MKTVDVFAVKEERVQRAEQILIMGRLLHALRPVVRYKLHPSALSSSRERGLCAFSSQVASVPHYKTEADPGTQQVPGNGKQSRCAFGP